MSDIESKLGEIKNQIAETRAPWKITPRELVVWAGFSRRGKQVNNIITRALQSNGLITKPDYQLAYIDSPVLMELSGNVPENPSDTREAVHRVGMLAAANKAPITVNKNDGINVAKTLMILHDFSQLPVMSTPRNVDGLITWKSMATATIRNSACSTVQECMVTNPQIVDHDHPLLDVVNLVLKWEVVLVRGEDKTITGLVTMADITGQFLELSEAFLLLEQIENHLRPLIAHNFTAEELKQALDPSDTEREISSVDDLTFGEYIRLIEKPENWEKLHMPLDRGTVIKRLNEVRELRNDVMHFHPDGIGDEGIQIIRQTASFFGELIDQ